MTSTVTELTIATFSSNTYEVLSASVGLIVILLLLFLVAEKELIRAFGGKRSQTWMRTLNLAIVPLLLAFGFIVVMRFADRLYFG
jgi:phosphoglycerol transferase MdoB-like AlkP superfamily enzyme